MCGGEGVVCSKSTLLLASSLPPYNIGGIEGGRFRVKLFVCPSRRKDLQSGLLAQGAHNPAWCNEDDDHGNQAEDDHTHPREVIQVLGQQHVEDGADDRPFHGADAADDDHEGHGHGPADAEPGGGHDVALHHVHDAAGQAGDERCDQVAFELGAEDLDPHGFGRRDVVAHTHQRQTDLGAHHDEDDQHGAQTENQRGEVNLSRADAVDRVDADPLGILDKAPVGKGNDQRLGDDPGADSEVNAAHLKQCR